MHDFTVTNVVCRRCGGSVGEAVEQEEGSCDEVEAVGEFTSHHHSYLGGRMGAIG